MQASISSLTPNAPPFKPASPQPPVSHDSSSTPAATNSGPASAAAQPAPDAEASGRSSMPEVRDKTVLPATNAQPSATRAAQVSFYHQHIYIDLQVICLCPEL